MYVIKGTFICMLVHRAKNLEGIANNYIWRGTLGLEYGEVALSIFASMHVNFKENLQGACLYGSLIILKNKNLKSENTDSSLQQPLLC